MPYIEPTLRVEWRPSLTPLLNEINLRESTPKGEVNYLLTRIVMTWLNKRGWSYNNMSDVKAVLTDARDEFVRRIMNPYEEKKLEQNGDVYF